MYRTPSTARHFNRGLSASFFALAAPAWFVHPLLLMAASVYVLYVLHRREFRSKSLRALRIRNDELSRRCAPTPELERPM